MIKFIIGMMVGGTVGFFTAALLVITKKDNEYKINLTFFAK